MFKPNIELGERVYEKEHIRQVLTEIEKNFPGYFESFIKQDSIVDEFKNSSFRITIKRSRSPEQYVEEIFNETISSFENEQPRYQKSLDLEVLEEYEDDPNAFKIDLMKKCPIVLRCMRSTEKEMRKYQAEYRAKSGQELLSVTTEIIKFGRKYISNFENEQYELVNSVEGLKLSDLTMEEKYISYRVIGGGIKSHFLYSLYPHAFANRSQNSIWSLYFLSGRKNFGFKDDSEFLMIDTKNTNEFDNYVTQQNYFYPYDLFSFYALGVYHLLKTQCKQLGFHFDAQYRYIYVDTFFNFIAEEKHGRDIYLLKGKEYEHAE